MAILQEIGVHQVLETRSGIGTERPVPEVELLFFFQALDWLAAKGPDAKTIVQVFQDTDPALDRLVGGREILPQGVDGEERGHPVLKQYGEQIQLADLPHLFQGDKILMDYSGNSFLLPTFPIPFRLSKKRFRGNRRT